MRTDIVKRAEHVAAILISLLVLFLLVLRAQHAGGLWRDECASMRLAQLSTFSQIQARFPFPVLFAALVRAHTAFFGTGDTSLRSFGAAVVIALICVAWINARLTRNGAPLIFLPLMALNATFLTWGTSIRGYGLGCVMIVLAAGLAARLLINPSLLCAVALFVTFLGAPHLLVHDAALVLAIAFAGTVVCLVRRKIKLALVFVTAAALSGISCLPYLFANFQRQAMIVLKYPTSLAGVWMNCEAACGPPASIMPIVWCALFLVATTGAIWFLVAWRRDVSMPSDLVLFAVLVSCISIAGYFAFLRVLNFWPHPWYYLPLFGILAFAIELMFGAISQNQWARLGRLAFTMGISVVLALAAYPKIIERQTNIDLIATNLEKNAVPRDLIVVNPWDRGVSFNWYYSGSAPWITVPMMSEHRIHRYDLLKAKMMSPNPLDDLYESIKAALQSGSRVWLVGGAQWLRPNEVPRRLPTAPNSEFGWNNDAYRNSWSQQLAAFIQAHVVHANMAIKPGELVNEVENEPVWELEGWRD